ncbi:MAG: glycoside hydrolase family 127 protein, partial [Chloroflexota bacterium]|nr:glycoside hydrolase family 127 protein [Chloroflexota bacterium]
ELEMDLESGLPWSGEVKIRIGAAPGKPITLRMRQPSWVSAVRVVLNGVDIRLVKRAPAATLMPQEATWLEITRTWKVGDQVMLDFELPIRILHAHRKVRSVSGKVAIARGPLVYCLESIDNSGVDLFAARLNSASLEAQVSELFDGAVTITGREISGAELTFIPYHLWGNRGPSQMSVFVRV